MMQRLNLSKTKCHRLFLLSGAHRKPDPNEISTLEPKSISE